MLGECSENINVKITMTKANITHSTEVMKMTSKILDTEACPQEAKQIDSKKI